MRPVDTEAARGRVAQASAPIEIALMGTFVLRCAGAPLQLPTKKSQALLAYLAFVPGRVHERERLAALLWPESPKAQAQASLRQTLLSLRKALAAARDALQSTHTTVALDAARVRVDVVALERWLVDGTSASLAHVAALCRGPLLADFVLGETSFDEWLESQRTRLKERTILGLDRLTELQLQAGCSAQAIETARCSLQLEPFHEPSHRTLMRLYAREGRRAEALRQYDACATLLKRELDIEPEAETEHLRAEILRARLAGMAAVAQAPARASESLVLEAGPALVGRDAELAQLAHAVERSLAGAGKLVLLAGDAGVGKTRLMQAVAARASAAGAHCVRGRCFESEQVLPFALFVDLLRSDPVFAQSARSSQLRPETRAEIARLLPQQGECALDRANGQRDARVLFQAVAELLSLVAAQAPLVIALDDLHWADSMSLRLLSFLARRIWPAAQLALIASARAEHLAEAALLSTVLREIEGEQRLLVSEVAPLSPADTLTLFRALAPARDPEIDPPVVDAAQLWSLCEGNPFVIVESARGFSTGARAPGAVELPVPLRVRELVLDHVDRLDPLAREVLATAAAIGRQFAFGLLLRACSCSEMELALAIESLHRTRLLQPAGDGFYFSHDRIREVVYARLLPARRRVLHGAIARALEQFHAEHLDEAAGAIGYHFARAGSADASVRYLTRFADRSEHDYGLEEALAALAEAQRQNAGLPEAERAARGVELAVRQARCLLFLGRASEMEAVLEPHRAAVERLARPELAAPFHVYLAMAYAYLGNCRATHEQEAHLLAAVEHCRDVTLSGLAQEQLSYLALRSGRFRRGIEAGRAALALLERGADAELTAIAWMNLGAAHAAVGEFQIAGTAFAEARAIGERADNARVRAMAVAFSGFVQVAVFGDLDAGLAACRSAVELAPDAYSSRYAHWLFVRASALSAVFAGETARTLFGTAFDASLATLAASATLDDPATRGWAGLALVAMAEASIALNQPEQARAQATGALTVLRAEGDPLGIAWGLRALGHAELALGRLEPAQALLEQARATFAAIDARFELATTLLSLAGIAAARQDGASATRQLRHAHAICAALALPRWTALIEQAAAASTIAI